MRSEVIGEGRYGGGIVALGNGNHDAGLVDVDKQSDVVLAAPGGGFIDREPGLPRPTMNCAPAPARRHNDE